MAQEKQKLKDFKKKSLVFFKNLERKKDELEIKINTEHEKNIFAIEDRTGKISFSIEIMQKLLSSPKFAGAIAEIDLINLLSALPNNYIVLNDVKLVANEAIRFDNVWRETAQIDSLVISPAGIFVIEVKNWSKGFIENNDFYSPYDQVKWHAYLCYKQTGIKTRSIIAHTGNIPAKPNDSYAKVLHVKDINGYILYFRDQVVSDAMIQKTANQLSKKPYLF